MRGNSKCPSSTAPECLHLPAEGLVNLRHQGFGEIATGDSRLIAHHNRHYSCFVEGLYGLSTAPGRMQKREM